ncbi:hypothetical protein VNI00_010435 [Paramarasmius palmivorus]|uniref:BHLH domain-containing protein n=1 Tax=Paramarasmius palmivorus TaxID=297713 RepID=A0AAW0CG54_9AGAR
MHYSSSSHASSGLPSSAKDDSISPKSTRNRSNARAPRTKNSFKKAVHNRNEQERRRRMNNNFEALAELIPGHSYRLNGTGRAPTKPEILASAVAYIRALRRHTALAASELRGMKGENDILRDQLNMRRGERGEIPIDEPVRGEGFIMVWRQEVEVMAEDNIGGIEEEDRTDSGGAEAEMSTVTTAAHQRHEQDIADPSSSRTIHPTNVHNYAPQSHDDSYFRHPGSLHAGSSTSLYPIYTYVPTTNAGEFPRIQTHTPTVPRNVDTRFDVQY